MSCSRVGLNIDTPNKFLYVFIWTDIINFI